MQRRDRQKAFQSTHRHYLLWIYWLVTLTASWYCGRNIHIEFYYRSNGNVIIIYYACVVKAAIACVHLY